jgi:hypothetical protein
VSAEPTYSDELLDAGPSEDDADNPALAADVAAYYASLNPPTDSRLTAVPLVDVTMKSISWLERPLWQRSAFQLLAGVKGSGKGTYLASLAARITHTGANALFVSSEDSTEIDLKPRLVAAGAAIERCFTITQHLRLPDDVPDLETLALSLGGVGLFVIDPVANHIGTAKPNDDVEVRHAIAPLNGLADRLDCLLIGVRHPGKDRSRGAVTSILGSTAWVDTPRAVVFIAVDNEDPAVRHIQVVAGNRSLNGRGQAFRIEGVEVAGLNEPITRAVELGESAKDVEQLLADDAEANRRAAPKRDEAAEVILRELADEPRPLDYLKAICAAEAGIAGDTVYRAANALKAERRVRCRNSGPGTPWLWSLDLTLASEEL